MKVRLGFLALACLLLNARFLLAEGGQSPQIDAAYPGGNIVVGRVEGDTVYLAPDQRDTQRGQWWFYWNFRLQAPPGRTVKVVFTEKNPIGVRGPAVSSDGGATWTWLGAGAVQTLLVEGKPAWSFPAAVPAGCREVRYAFCIPYLEADLRAWLDRHGGDSALRREELCRSRKGRGVELLRAGCLDDPRGYVLLTARHHCCETMGTYALEGLLEEVLRDERWRERRLQVVAVPFVDKDGVEDGDQGKFRAPHDHNRDYNEEPVYPEVKAIKELGKGLGEKVVAAMDLHCPHIRGEWNDRVYFVGQEGEKVWAGQVAYAQALERVREGTIRFRAGDCLPFGKAWNTGGNYVQGQSFGRWARDSFPGAALTTTVEIAYADARGDEVNAASARALGRDLARALMEHLPP